MRAAQLAIMLAAGVLAAVVGPASPADAKEVLEDEPHRVLEVPTPRFSWSVPDRYQLGWRAWSERRGRYRRAYVRPRRWTLDVDACRSSGGGNRITGYELRVKGVGFDFRTGSRGTSCRRRFSDLPRIGGYDVRLVVQTTAGPSHPLIQRISLRDWLVVSLGDSMASGEGVPDTPGLYTPPFTLTDTVATLARLFRGNVRMHQVRRVDWQDRRCHRSARAGHAQAALALERRDPHSSVTFVSLACSGATIAHLIDKEYAGIQPPPGDEKLQPQLEALRTLVGAGGGSRRRRVDALLLSIGVNDLGFSDIVKGCAMNWNGAHGTGDPDCVYDAGVTKKLAVGGTLEDSYAKFATALRDSLDVADVYLTDYPGAPFGQHRGGCGLLAIPGFGIGPREAEAMATVGLQLYWAVGRAAAAQGWNWVPGMTDAFAGRDYCAPKPLLVRLESSLLRQGTIHGAVHPTRAGQLKLGDLLARSIVFRPDLPHWRAKLVVEQVFVDPAFKDTTRLRKPQPTDPTGQPVLPPPPSDKYAFDFALRTIPNWPAGARLRFTTPKATKGQWIAVPPELGTFELDVYDPPRPPRYPTSVNFLAYGPSGTVGADHTFGQGFGVGCHKLVHPTGWTIRYRIELTPVDGTPGRPPIVPPGEIVPPCRQELAP